MSGSGAAAPLAWTPARIEAIETRTARVRSYFLDAPLAPHVAGQHVDVRLTAPDGYAAQRSYSIASAPGDPRIELAIERLADGEVSGYFHDIAQPGDTVDVRGPLGGHFVWRSADGGPLLLVGGGSGIVPLMAMLRDRAAHAAGLPTLLVYSSRSWDDIIFRDEVLDLQRRDTALSVLLATTRGPARRAGDLDRRVDRGTLRACLDRWAHPVRHAYVCGATAFVEAITGALVEEGVPAPRIRAERYGGAGLA